MKKQILSLKDFKILTNNFGDVYNSLIVFREFCNSCSDVEEISYILPILKHIVQDVDGLYAQLLNIKNC